MQRGVQVLACMAATALAGFIAGWFMHGAPTVIDCTAPPTAVAQRESVAEAKVEPRVDAVSERVAVEAVAQTPKDAPKMRDALDILQAALASHPHFEGDYAPYVEKYAGASVDEMRLAQFALDRQVNSERSKIIEQLIQSGRVDSQFVREGEEPPGIGTSRESPIASGWLSIEPGDGGATIKTAKIDPAEHPEFHDLEMEAWWLASEVRHLDHTR